MKRFWRLTSVGLKYILKPDIDSEPLQYEMCRCTKRVPNSHVHLKMPGQFPFIFFLLELNFQQFVKLVYEKHTTGCF